MIVNNPNTWFECASLEVFLNILQYLLIILSKLEKKILTFESQERKVNPI